MSQAIINSLFVGLIVCALVSGVYWLAVAIQVWMTARQIPSARDGIALADEDPPSESVCVLVPCHNEAGNIATLIESLKEQDYDRLRVVLVLDRCTDDTLGVARSAIGADSRFEIIEVSQCPDEWAGKVHAAYMGYTQSAHANRSEVLIFTDADTWLDRACVRACVALLDDRGLDFLSLFSTLSQKSWYEKLVQPITAFELARQFPLLRVNRSDERRRAFANGQFMMFNREAYDAIGGHEGVKEAVLEDIRFAQVLMHRGYQAGLLLAENMLKCRMYDSWDEYKRGWKRIYTESANREVGRLKRYAFRTPLMGAFFPIASGGLVAMSLFVGEDSTRWIGVLVGILGIVGWLIGMFAVYRLSKSPIWCVPGALVGSLMTGMIFWAAAKDLIDGTPTQWGGKSYVRKAEDA
ncbi:MAG: glycosyltransferase [Phycisphaerales bacterium]